MDPWAMHCTNSAMRLLFGYLVCTSFSLVFAEKGNIVVPFTQHHDVNEGQVQCQYSFTLTPAKFSQSLRHPPADGISVYLTYKGELVEPRRACFTLRKDRTTKLKLERNNIGYVLSGMNGSHSFLPRDLDKMVIKCVGRRMSCVLPEPDPSWRLLEAKRFHRSSSGPSDEVHQRFDGRQDSLYVQYRRKQLATHQQLNKDFGLQGVDHISRDRREAVNFAEVGQTELPGESPPMTKITVASIVIASVLGIAFAVVLCAGKLKKSSSKHASVPPPSADAEVQPPANSGAAINPHSVGEGGGPAYELAPNGGQDGSFNPYSDPSLHESDPEPYGVKESLFVQKTSLQLRSSNLAQDLDHDLAYEGIPDLPVAQSKYSTESSSLSFDNSQRSLGHSISAGVLLKSRVRPLVTSQSVQLPAGAVIHSSYKDDDEDEPPPILPPKTFESEQLYGTGGLPAISSCSAGPDEIAHPPPSQTSLPLKMSVHSVGAGYTYADDDEDDLPPPILPPKTAESEQLYDVGEEQLKHIREAALSRKVSVEYMDVEFGAAPTLGNDSQAYGEISASRLHKELPCAKRATKSAYAYEDVAF